MLVNIILKGTLTVAMMLAETERHMADSTS